MTALTAASINGTGKALLRFKTSILGGWVDRTENVAYTYQLSALPVAVESLPAGLGMAFAGVTGTKGIAPENDKRAIPGQVADT